MKTASRWTLLGLVCVMAAAIASPAAFADDHSQQKNKNTWRNLGVAGAVVTGYGLLHHNTTTTLLGAAGTAYSLHRYEQDRHSQSQGRDARKQAYYRRRHHYYYDRNGVRHYYRY